MDTIYCYSNGGLSWRLVDSSYKPEKGEKVFKGEHPSPAELSKAFSNFDTVTHNNKILNEISVLEESVTKSDIREAVLGLDNGRLLAINKKIEKLKGELK